MSRAIVRAPATRDQADAYRFGLRRLEAALVRGDPVPLHEQIRSQRRAALAGVALGLLGLCGTAAHALLTAGPEPTPESVAVGSWSGAAALPGVVGLRPDATVPPRWAVCEQVDADGRIVRTTVIGGTSLSESMSPRDGLLLAGPDGATWLVTAGRRHRVDTGDGKLLAALGIARRSPRAAGADLLALLPEGPPLATPEVPGRGGPAPAGLPGRIGDVLVAPRPGGGARHAVVLASGVQEVPAVPAELLRVASGAAAARPVAAEVLAAAPAVDDLLVGDWPAGPARVRDAAEAPVVCWTWSAAGAPTGAVWAGDAVPAGAAPVELAQADGPDERVDAVAVGAGGAVRATAPGRPAGSEPWWLVSTTGVAHRVTDAATVDAFGIRAAEPAPDAALRLLPRGPDLDLADAARVADGRPVG